MDYRQTHLAKGGSYDATIAAQPFDAYMALREAACLREIVPRLMPERGRYLDFACGTGRITEIVAPMASESIGIDISESMLATARLKCPQTRFICADVTQQRLDLKPFDLVTSFRFFGNAEHGLRVAALGAIGGLVKTGGHLIVNSHRNPHAIGALLQRLRGLENDMDLSYWKMRKLLRDNGFRIRAVRTIGFWVVRARMRTPATLESARAVRADRLFRLGLWAPFAPDCVLIAQKL